MRRLSGEDSQFIFQETHAQHQHTMKVVVVDPTGAHAIPTYESFRAGIRDLIPHTEPFRRQLVTVPLRLGHPYWIETPYLDLDYHVRRATVATPGGRRELAEIISWIASIGLERNRPLWQAWMVDGLEGGRLGFVMKVHHSLADGLASARLLLDMLQDSPDPIPDPGPLEALPSDEIPGRIAVTRTAAVDTARQLAAVPALGASIGRWALATLGQKRRGEQHIAKSFTVPKLRWNAPLTPHRWFAYDTVSLGEMKRVKDAWSTDDDSVTVNDVFLATITGGVRRYLLRHDELPDIDLTATVPVATRGPDQARDWGNRMTSWMVDLATTTEDPVERLRAIAARTKAVRAAREQRGVDLQHDMMEAWPFFTVMSNWLPAAVVRAGDKATFSLIASNVPGPRTPLYADGSRVTEVISMGPLVKDIGLNFTGWSYCDDFTIGVVACHEHMPDLWDLMDDTLAAFAELVELTPSDRR